MYGFRGLVQRWRLLSVSCSCGHPPAGSAFTTPPYPAAVRSVKVSKHYIVFIPIKFDLNFNHVLQAPIIFHLDSDSEFTFYKLNLCFCLISFKQESVFKLRGRRGWRLEEGEQCCSTSAAVRWRIQCLQQPDVKPCTYICIEL